MKSFISFVVFFVLGSSAWAQGVRAVAGGNYSHTLMTGLGVAHPSATTAIGTNPAGLIYNNGMRLSHTSAIDDTRSGVIGQQGLLVGGNGFFGAALGISDYENLAADKSGFPSVGVGTLAQAGWAGHIQKSRFAFGMSIVAPLTGSRMIVNSGSSTVNQPLPSYSDRGASVNAGVIFDPMGSTRFGFTAYQFGDKFESFGLGFAHDMLDNFTFVVDISYSKASKTAEVVPGINFSTPYFSLAAAYGSKFMGEGWGYARDGFSGGIGFTMLKELSITASYHQVQAFTLGLTAQM
ncbi:MAG: hypothetical protein JNL01_11735 [Bdellovibrionales bacterium]|nr:hypothetical protein [Bdellovibrionales bacterium]